MLVGVFIHWQAADDKKIYQFNYEATKESIERALKGLPTVDSVVSAPRPRATRSRASTTPESAPRSRARGAGQIPPPLCLASHRYLAAGTCSPSAPGCHDHAQPPPPARQLPAPQRLRPGRRLRRRCRRDHELRRRHPRRRPRPGPRLHLHPRPQGPAPHRDLDRRQQHVRRASSCWRWRVDAMFAPFTVSVMLDSNGSNTTAVAAVVKIEQTLGDLKGKKVLVLAGTGPVGQRAAGLLAQGRRPRHDHLAQAGTGRQGAPVHQRPVRRPGGGDHADRPGPGCRERARGRRRAAQLRPGRRADGAQGGRGRPRKTLKVAVDLNAVPPLGIEGVEVNDAGEKRDGVAVFGAFGVGQLQDQAAQALRRPAVQAQRPGARRRARSRRSRGELVATKPDSRDASRHRDRSRHLIRRRLRPGRRPDLPRRDLAHRRAARRPGRRCIDGARSAGRRPDRRPVRLRPAAASGRRRQRRRPAAGLPGRRRRAGGIGGLRRLARRPGAAGLPVLLHPGSDSPRHRAGAPQAQPRGPRHRRQGRRRGAGDVDRAVRRREHRRRPL